MSEQVFNILQNPADVGGCSHYRMRFPEWALQTIRRDIRFVSSMKLICYPDFFRDIRVVRLQRQVSNAQADYFLKFLYPLSNSLGFWIVYEIDDVIGYEDIPAYNHAKEAFGNEKFFSNVQNMLNCSDFITVTTDNLKNYYHTKYGIPEAKIIVIPNYLPRWWVGEAYQPDRIIELYQDNIKKPRILLPLSSSHYDLKNVNNNVDDLSGITDFIRSTCQKYQWCFIGHCPRQLEDLARDKKIEIWPGSDLLNYPRELYMKKPNVILAPLQDNVFNRAKSNIKLLESWALGVPAIVQNLEPYAKYTDSLFSNNNELQNQLDSLFSDKKRYMKIVKNNRRIVDFGDKHAPNGWWLEKNLGKWNQLFTINQKTLRLDIRKKMNESNEKGLTIDL